MKRLQISRNDNGTFRFTATGWVALLYLLVRGAMMALVSIAVAGLLLMGLWTMRDVFAERGTVSAPPQQGQWCDEPV